MQSCAHSGAELVVFEVRVRMPGLQGLGRKKKPGLYSRKYSKQVSATAHRTGSIDINICSAHSAQPVVFTNTLYTHSDGPEVSEEPPKQTEVFTRIDVSKLHSALDAMKLGTMEVCLSVSVCV